ncbi:MAG: YfhO family protein [Desulfobulbaceae bacterium]|nr:YfhO family protein [Desulfobulbaceae bacterium]
MKKNRVEFVKLIREKELLVFILMCTLYFIPVLFSHQTFFYRDLYLLFFSRKLLLLEFLKQGQFPLWDPFLHGGHTYLAEVSNGAFYPFNVIFCIFPFIRAFNIFFIFHIIAVGISLYAFHRVLGAKPLTCLVTAITASFCGYTLSLVNLSCYLTTMPYVGFMLLSWHLYHLELKKRWFAATVLFGICQVFAGASELNILTMLLLLGWSLFFPYESTTSFRRFINWIILGIFTVSISAIQIIPTIELISLSSRNVGIAYGEATAWSLYPQRLGELLFPYFFGYIDIFSSEQSYWGSQLIDQTTSYIVSIYFGSIVLIFTLLSGTRQGGLSTIPRRTRLFLLATFCCSIILAMGKFLPFFSYIFKIVPGIQSFRSPIKFMLITIPLSAILTGATAEYFFSGQKRATGQTRYTAILFFTIAILSGLLSLSFLYSDTLPLKMATTFFNGPLSQIMQSGLTKSFFHASLFALAISFLCFYRSFDVSPRPFIYWIFTIILSLDLLIAGLHINPTAPDEFFTHDPPVVNMARKQITNGRLYHSDTESIKDSNNLTLKCPNNKIMWPFRFNMEVLNFYLGSLYNIPIIYHKDPTRLSQQRMVTLTQKVEQLPWQERIPLLSMASVEAIVTNNKLDSSDLQFVGEIKNMSFSQFFMYKNINALTGTTFVRNGLLANTGEEALQAVLDKNFDPRKVIVLEKDQSLTNLTNSTNDGSLEEKKCSVQIFDNDINKIKHASSRRLTVSSDCSGYLYFSEPFYPGWRVLVDGKQTPIFRANYVFSAIALKPGEHVIEKKYRPSSIIIGAIVSCLFLLILSFYCRIPYRRNQTGL